VLLTIAALLIGAALGFATGGRLRHAARRRIAWWGLIVTGLGLEVVADRWLAGPFGYLAMVAGPLCLLLWAARNARLAGMGVVALGVLANLLVLGVDGGMPVRPAALTKAGIVAPTARVLSVSGHRHHVETASDHLRFLDDWIPLPPAHDVVSLGDLLLAVGAANVVAHLLWYEPRYQRARRPRWLGADLGARLASGLERAADGVGTSGA
jgi:hypothetical protein